MLFIFCRVATILTCLIFVLGTATPAYAQLQEATAQARDDAQKVIQANKELLAKTAELESARAKLVISLSKVTDLLPDSFRNPTVPLVPMCVTEYTRGCFGRCRTVQRIIWVPEDQVIPKKYEPQTIRRRIREELEQIRNTLLDSALVQPTRAAEFVELNLQAVGLLTLIQRLQLQ